MKYANTSPEEVYAVIQYNSYILLYIFTQKLHFFLIHMHSALFAYFLHNAYYKIKRDLFGLYWIHIHWFYAPAAKGFLYTEMSVIRISKVQWAQRLTPDWTCDTWMLFHISIPKPALIINNCQSRSITQIQF